MPPVSKVELYAAIRRDARAGMSGRAMERKHGVGRRTIIKALSSAWPEPRKKLPPRPSKLDSHWVLAARGSRETGAAWGCGWSRAGVAGDRCAARAPAGAVTGSRVADAGRVVHAGGTASCGGMR
jgi:hypothetical protein